MRPSDDTLQLVYELGRHLPTQSQEAEYEKQAATLKSKENVHGERPWTRQHRVRYYEEAKSVYTILHDVDKEMADCAFDSLAYWRVQQILALKQAFADPYHETPLDGELDLVRPARLIGELSQQFGWPPLEPDAIDLLALHAEEELRRCFRAARLVRLCTPVLHRKLLERANDKPLALARNLNLYARHWHAAKKIMHIGQLF